MKRPSSLNMKNLSLDLPAKPRRPSIVSLPPSTASFLHRRDEDGSPSVPYAAGPVEIIPGIWLGSEDNARDWKSLIERGIKSVLNVAKEVASPFDHSPLLRAAASTPDLKAPSSLPSPVSTYKPPNLLTGRPGMHYLKLQWSHGQQDLVHSGFPAAMAFTDAALHRREGVLIQFVISFFSPLISSHPPLAVNAVSPDPLPWPSPSS